jgi:hypothetical protein
LLTSEDYRVQRITQDPSPDAVVSWKGDDFSCQGREDKADEVPERIFDGMGHPEFVTGRGKIAFQGFAG